MRKKIILYDYLALMDSNRRKRKKECVKLFTLHSNEWKYCNFSSFHNMYQLNRMMCKCIFDGLMRISNTFISSFFFGSTWNHICIFPFDEAMFPNLIRYRRIMKCLSVFASFWNLLCERINKFQQNWRQQLISRETTSHTYSTY